MSDEKKFYTVTVTLEFEMDDARKVRASQTTSNPSVEKLGKE